MSLIGQICPQREQECKTKKKILFPGLDRISFSLHMASIFFFLLLHKLVQSVCLAASQNVKHPLVTGAYKTSVQITLNHK